MKAALAALLLASAAWAGPEREAPGAKAIPSVPSGLGQSAVNPAASVLPGGQVALTLPTLPASSVPNSILQPTATASQPKAAQAYAPGVTAAKVAEGASPLTAAGLWKNGADVLAGFAADPSLFPKTDEPSFHDAALALKLAQSAAAYGGTANQRDGVLLSAAALLMTLDPSRQPGTLPRPSFTADFLAQDPRANALFEKLAALNLPGGTGISREEVTALVTGQGLVSYEAKGLRARLVFLREIAPFLGNTSATQQAIARFAAEQRATASSALGRKVDAPTDEQAYASFHIKLEALKGSPYYALLPNTARGRFEDALMVLDLFREDAGSKISVKPALNKGPPNFDKQTSDDERSFARYAKSILPERALTTRELEGFVAVFLEDRNIDPDSARGQALRRALTPKTVAEEQRRLNGLDPKLLDWGTLILKYADLFSVTPAHVEAVIKQSGVTASLSGKESRELVDSLLYRMMLKDKIQRLVADYPDTVQGRVMRELASQVTTRSGKSIEEEVRSGAFLYVDFSPSKKVLHVSSGRDPDNTSCDMLFYVTLEEGDQWKLSGYRQNRRPGRPTGSDLSFQNALRDWLVDGEVPEKDLRF